MYWRTSPVCEHATGRVFNHRCPTSGSSPRRWALSESSEAGSTPPTPGQAIATEGVDNRSLVPGEPGFSLDVSAPQVHERQAVHHHSAVEFPSALVRGQESPAQQHQTCQSDLGGPKRLLVEQPVPRRQSQRSIPRQQGPSEPTRCCIATQQDPAPAPASATGTVPIGESVMTMGWTNGPPPAFNFRSVGGGGMGSHRPLMWVWPAGPLLLVFLVAFAAPLRVGLFETLCDPKGAWPWENGFRGSGQATPIPWPGGGGGSIIPPPMSVNPPPPAMSAISPLRPSFPPPPHVRPPPPHVRHFPDGHLLRESYGFRSTQCTGWGASARK